MYCCIYTLLSDCCIIYTNVPGSMKSAGLLYIKWLCYYDQDSGNTAGIIGATFLIYFGLGKIITFIRLD